jgi:hypothetical protein
MRVEKGGYHVWWKNFKWGYDDTAVRPVDNVWYSLVCISISSGSRTYVDIAKVGPSYYGRTISVRQLFFIIENRVVIDGIR